MPGEAIGKGQLMEKASTLLHDLAQSVTERITTTAGSQLVFGAAEAHGDQTVIPVAEVRYRFGFGGGGGSQTGLADGGHAEEPGNQGEGAGGGGGAGGAVHCRPVGFIRMQGDEATFVPILDYTRVIASMLAFLAVLTWIAVRVTRARD